MKFLIIAGLANSLIGFRKPLIQALLAKGITVHAAAPELLANEKVKAELESMGVILHDIPMARTGMNPLLDLKTLWALYRLMRAIKPDYAMGYTIKPVVYGGLAAWLARVPKRFALITGLGYAFVDDGSRKQRIINSVASKLYKQSLSRAHTVFFQNPDDEALFKQLGILQANANSVVVNGSGVGVDEYPFTPIAQDAAPRFLLIARLLGDKGVREYAEAARIIKQQYPQVQFDLVGRLDVNPNAITQAELDTWIADGRITHHGYQSDVKPFIAASTVYVLPSYREGTPRSVLEAMSMGRAIITTDAPGCRETVIEGENGYLVPVKDAQALADAMLKFIEQPSLAVTMGKRSREIAEEKYDVNKVNAHMLKEMGIQ